MTYALIRGGIIVAESATLPISIRRADGEWVNPPNGTWTLPQAAALGWFPVTLGERPSNEDTLTFTHTRKLTVVGGLPVETWVARDLTTTEMSYLSRLNDMESRMRRVENHLWPEPPEPQVPSDAPPFVDVWPDRGLILDGGVVYRNISGVPLVWPPSKFPGPVSAWTHLFEVALAADPVDPVDPPPPSVLPWHKDTTYAVGDKASRNGRIYQAKVAHGAEYQGTWGPPLVSVWTDLGPA